MVAGGGGGHCQAAPCGTGVSGQPARRLQGWLNPRIHLPAVDRAWVRCFGPPAAAGGCGR